MICEKYFWIYGSFCIDFKIKVFFNYRLFSIFVKIIYGYFKGYGYNLIKFFKYVYLINYVWNVVYVVG